jgi:ABC-type uncharacterized transport system substrate-binding protein
MMHRRAFLRTLAGGLLAAPLAAVAQQAGKVCRIGYLATGSPGPPFRPMLEQGLRERGWVAGENLAITYRDGEGKYERLPALAAELVRLEPQVIVAASTAAAQAAKGATSTIPIVMWGVSDPIGAGLFASFARPGGNVTELTGTNPFETDTKQMQLLKEAVPRARRIAFLWNPANATSIPAVKAVKEAAQTLGVELQVVSARAPEEFEPAFRTLTQAPADALFVAQEALFTMHFPRLADLSAKRRLPTICGLDGYAKAGGLMNYSVALADTVPRVADYVDRLLLGPKPADLAVEQPTKFELLINVKTAKALELTIPQSLLGRADEVIE